LIITSYTKYKTLILKMNELKHVNKQLDFVPDGREHYVYRVTDYNRNVKQHYYGSHTPPKNKKYNNLIDEFWTYKTSSKKNILNENVKNNYKVKIIKVFNNPADKIILESYLHQYFDVKNNNLFWNESNQTPFMFILPKGIYIKIGKKVSKTKQSKEWKETIGKEIYKKQSEIRGSKEWKETIGKETNKKHRETVNSKEWKETIGKEASKKQSKTKNSKEWKETVGYKVIEKLKNTYKKKGKQWLKIRTQKGVKTYKEKKDVIQENGLTFCENVEKKKRITLMKKRSYDVYNHNDVLIYKDLLQIDILSINQGLLKTNKNKRLGNNFQGKRALNENNKLHMKGWYCEKRTNN